MKTLPTNPRVTYRTATAQDVIEFVGQATPYTMAGLAFFYDGILSGLGGYKKESGVWVIFSDMRENLNISKQTVFRCAKIILEFCKRRKVPMFVFGGNEALILRLGMEKMSDEVYRLKE